MNLELKYNISTIERTRTEREGNYMGMKILVACEESQTVCKAFRELGHEAYSCDIEPCSGGFPEWHINNDVIPLLNGFIGFYTQDGKFHETVYNNKWDIIIAFPPCTYLTVTGNRWFDVERYGEKAMQRFKDRQAAYNFFMQFANADCEKIAIENPVGYISTAYMKPTQIVHPYMFGEPARKATCLWLKGLYPLKPTNVVEPEIIHYKNGKGSDNPWHMGTINLSPHERAKERSKTFPGIAKAMAEQWGKEERE